MKTILAIVKNEVRKVFKNKKMLISIFILPVFLVSMSLLLVYMQQKPEGEKKAEEYAAYFLNMKIEEKKYELNGITLKLCNSSEAKAQELIERQELDKNAIIVEKVNERVNIYSCSTDSTAVALVKVIENQVITPVERSNFAKAEGYDKISHMEIEMKDTSSQAAKDNLGMAMMLPYLMIILLFMNITSVVCDSIAGEKEKGTLGKLMLSPISSKEIVAGKIAGNAVIGLISSLVYILVLLGISTLSEKFLGTDMMGMSGSSLNGIQVLMLLGGFMMLGLVFVAIVTLISANAKTAKEASNMTLPVYIIVMAAAMAAMMSAGAAGLGRFLIPVYNISLLMQNIIKDSVKVTEAAVTFIALGGITILLGAAIIQCFKREKLMY